MMFGREIGRFRSMPSNCSVYELTDHFSLVIVCNDPQCKSREVSAQKENHAIFETCQWIKEGQFF